MDNRNFPTYIHFINIQEIIFSALETPYLEALLRLFPPLCLERVPREVGSSKHLQIGSLELDYKPRGKQPQHIPNLT